MSVLHTILDWLDWPLKIAVGMALSAWAVRVLGGLARLAGL